MFNSQRLANNIATKVALELNFDNDKKEVIAYGAFALIQMIFSIIIVIIFGAIFNVMLEALIISFTTSILRKSSGGVHASSPSICTLMGTIICVGLARLLVFIISPIINFNYSLLLGIITFIWSYCMIYKLAPVDSVAKPIKTEEKRKRLKKSSILILSFYLAIVLINFTIHYFIREKIMITYTLCIYVGILWQVFSITKIGHLILGKVDTFFNILLKIIRGGRA